MIILVYIVEASGLNYPNQKIIATASLGRNVLETKVSSPRNTTRFDSSLAWKTDVNSIKRMKSENIPIKVECFCVGKTGGRERELIGFVVVPLRSVNILTGNKVMTISPKWHRLIGLRCTWKTLKPEILMFVTITDVVGMQIVNEMRNSTSTATRNMLIPQQGIHIELNRSEQHIQIGDAAADSDRFTVEIYWQQCRWLSYLAENPSAEDSFQMRYTLLDCPTVERNLPKMFGAVDEDRYMVHEKITIQLRSSLQTLRKYFESVFYIPIYIYCKEEIVGRAFFKISSALPDTNDLTDFLRLTRDDTFVAISESFIYSTKSSITFIDEEHRPTLKYNLTLKYHDPSKETQDTQQYHAQSLVNETKSNEGRQYFESENRQSDANKPSTNEHQTLSGSPSDQSGHVNDKTISTGRETVQQSIERRNVLIQQLLNSQIDPPMSPQKIETIRFVDVATPPLTTRAPSPQLPQSPKLCRRNDENISPSRARDGAFTSPLRSPKNVTFHPQSDDEIAAWKCRQQEAFLAGLERKENEHLKLVEEEWLQRHRKEEEKLAVRMKKCKMLTEALEHGLSVVKEKDTISMDQKKLNEAAQLERNKQYDEKISDLTDQIRRSAIDHDYQLKLMEIKLKELEMKKAFADDENDKLKATVKRLEDENELLRGRNMELESVSSRKLQSIELKLKHAQELELFYKTKWQSAESKLSEVQTIRPGHFAQNTKHFSSCVVDVLNSVRSDLEADKYELQSIKDMLE
ncbi:hypothetical protein HA402_009078 [Bradysia odoriphaga]|nr:hypothetical protein HA402_009078 [Bradysia odoriphaga]